MESYSLWSLLMGFLHLAQCFHAGVYIVHLSFSLLSNVVWISYLWLTHSSVDWTFEVVSTFWLLGVLLWTFIYIFPGYMPRSRLAVSYFKELPGCFQQQLYHFIFPLVYLFYCNHLSGCVLSYCNFLLNSLMATEVQYIFMCFWPIVYLLRKNVLTDPLPIF